MRISITTAYQARFEDARRSLATLRTLSGHFFIEDDVSADLLPVLSTYKETTDARLVTLARRRGLMLSAGLAGGLVYIAVGFGALLLGEVPFFVMSSNAPDGRRGAGPLYALLCFVSGLALCSYARWYDKNKPWIKLEKEKKRSRQEAIEADVRGKYEQDLAEATDYWKQEAVEDKIRKEINHRLASRSRDESPDSGASTWA
jgi:hypothetical protein